MKFMVIKSKIDNRLISFYLRLLGVEITSIFMPTYDHYCIFIL